MLFSEYNANLIIRLIYKTKRLIDPCKLIFLLPVHTDKRYSFDVFNKTDNWWQEMFNTSANIFLFPSKLDHPFVFVFTFFAFFTSVRNIIIFFCMYWLQNFILFILAPMPFGRDAIISGAAQICENKPLSLFL